MNKCNEEVRPDNHEDNSAFRNPHSELSQSNSSLPTSETEEPDVNLLQRWLDLNA
jgi:hypothetical protein